MNQPAIPERRPSTLGGVWCQAELLALFDELVDVMFCVKGIDGRYLAVNAAFVRRTGRATKRAVIGATAGDLFLAALAERYERQDAEVIETARALRDQLELIRRENGSTGWYLTTKLPVCGDDGAVTAIVSVSRDLQTPSDDDEGVRSLSSVVEHVRDHLAETVRVADLVAAAGCSASQLDRRMRKVFGISPTQYVLRAKVDHAAHLLTTTEMTLSSVAAESGFYDQADFTHRFARLTNETPAQFRSRLRTP